MVIALARAFAAGYSGLAVAVVDGRAIAPPIAAAAVAFATAALATCSVAVESSFAIIFDYQ
jgi:hypothetical protein